MIRHDKNEIEQGQSPSEPSLNSAKDFSPQRASSLQQFLEVRLGIAGGEALQVLLKLQEQGDSCLSSNTIALNILGQGLFGIHEEDFKAIGGPFRETEVRGLIREYYEARGMETEEAQGFGGCGSGNYDMVVTTAEEERGINLSCSIDFLQITVFAPRKK